MQNGMSALPPKADMCNAQADVRFVPIAGTHAPQQTASLFDHLVGKRKKRVRHSKIHRFGGFQVEHEQVARRLLDRQIGGFRAFENAVDQRGGAIKGISRRSAP